MLFEHIKARFLAEEIGFPHGQVTGKYFDLALRDRRGQEPVGARQRIRHAEVGGGSDDAPLQVIPATCRKMQAEACGKQVTETAQEKLGDSRLHATLRRLLPWRCRWMPLLPAKGNGP